MTTYKEAGVNIDLANKAVVKIKDLVKGTFDENRILEDCAKTHSKRNKKLPLNEWQPE